MKDLGRLRVVGHALRNRVEQLTGKTVVDITNPLNFETFDSLVVPVGSSAAAELQKALPGARVLKAFNTNFAATLAAGTVGTEKTTVLVAGDDADAKAALINAVTAGGLAALDAGALARAHELEAIGFLQLRPGADDDPGAGEGHGDLPGDTRRRRADGTRRLLQFRSDLKQGR